MTGDVGDAGVGGASIRWKRVTIASRDLPRSFEGDGTLTLEDGRTLVLPADPRCRIDPATGVDDGQARYRWREMDRATGSGRSPRLRIVDGRVVAVAQADVTVHPVDLAILGALGLNVAAARAAQLDAATWVAPGVAHEPPEMPAGFDVTMFSRFSAHVRISPDVFYESGQLTLERDLPATMLVALTGRPLREVVSVPRLDELDLPIHLATRQPSPFGGRTTTLLDLIPWDAKWDPLCE